VAVSVKLMVLFRILGVLVLSSWWPVIAVRLAIGKWYPKIPARSDSLLSSRCMWYYIGHSLAMLAGPFFIADTRHLGLCLSTAGRDMLWGGCALVLFAVVTMVIVWILGEPIEQAPRRRISFPDSLVMLIHNFVLIPAAEEIAFRGMLLLYLSNFFPVWVAFLF